MLVLRDPKELLRHVSREIHRESLAACCWDLRDGIPFNEDGALGKRPSGATTRARHLDAAHDFSNGLSGHDWDGR